MIKLTVAFVSLFSVSVYAFDGAGFADVQREKIIHELESASSGKLSPSDAAIERFALGINVVRVGGGSSGGGHGL